MIALVLLILIVLLGMSLVVAQQGRRPVLTRQQIEQQAMDYARQHKGNVVALQVRQTTFGQERPMFCSLYQTTIQSLATATGLNRWNGCDPSTPYWEVDLQGTFDMNGQPVDTMNISYLYDGTFMSSSTSRGNPR